MNEPEPQQTTGSGVSFHVFQVRFGTPGECGKEELGSFQAIWAARGGNTSPVEPKYVVTAGQYQVYLHSSPLSNPNTK